MKNPIHSTTAKYIVNVLMIGIFVALAHSGLFGGEGNRPGERHGKRHEQFSQNRERFEREDSEKAAAFNPTQDFGNRHGEEEGNHDIYGIIWLVLMALHTYQHWGWYKKMLSAKHLLKNKLLTATVVLFVILSLSSIALLVDLVPRGFINIKEIHEISGYAMVGLVVVHVAQRLNWYVKSTRKLFGKKKVETAIA
jgi:hypothetical protein